MNTRHLSRRRNALKHGAFSQELIILGENQRDFDDLLNGLVEDLKIFGRSEEECVFNIAKLMWRRLRVDRFFADEARWILSPPENDLKTLYQLKKDIREGQSCEDVLQKLELLPRIPAETIKKDCPAPSAEYSNKWIREVIKWIDTFIELEKESIEEEGKHPKHVSEMATSLHAEMLKQMDLIERLDAMLDKEFKRLAAVKTFKDVLAVQGASLPKKISHVSEAA